MISILMIWIATLLAVGNAFTATNRGIHPLFRVETRLFLEDRIADMIDDEIYRLAHKKDFERKWMEKNKAAVLHSLGGSHGAGGQENLSVNFDDDAAEFRQHRIDVKMATNDPVRYCADRCVATGNCDVFEDFFHLSPEEVLSFCEECVLSEEGECTLPHDFYEVGKLMP